MQLPTITMPVEEAAAKLKAYRAELKKRDNPEYRAVAKGLEALIKGKPLIRLSQAIIAGGVDDKGRPRLAVANSAAHAVVMERDRIRSEHNGASTLSFYSGDNVDLGRWAINRARSRGAGSRILQTIRVAGGSWPAFQENQWSISGRAMVPMIPAEVRQEVGRFQARACLTLFEAEWSPEPPVDPALLRPLGGDLYAVLAVWDLTDLERAVLAQSRA